MPTTPAPRTWRDAAGVVRRRRRPALEPARDLRGRHVEVERLAIDVDRDLVAFPDDRDRAAERGFRRDVADHQAVRAAAEAAVGEQRHGLAEALADERAGDVEHLLHPGSADRAFVADHDHVARVDLAARSPPLAAVSGSKTRAGPVW